MPFTEHDDVIEQFPAERPDKPFYIRILPRTPVGRSHLFNVAAVQELPHSVAVDAVIVTPQVPGLEDRNFLFVGYSIVWVQAGAADKAAIPLVKVQPCQSPLSDT